MHSLLKSFLQVLLLSAVLIWQGLPAQAASLLRDPDMEHGLQQLAKPVLEAAGLPANTVRVLVIKDSSLNAFVIDSQHIFIHSGLLLKLQSADQLQAVLAHEAAHIANGHLARRRQNIRNAKSAAALGLALAVAAAAGGADPAAAGGLTLGVASSADRLFKTHTRAEESSADASAIRYMLAAKADPEAFVEVLRIFEGQEMLSAHRQDPYARTHPLTRDRLRAVKALAAAAGKSPKGDMRAAYWFDRVQGKLSAFLRAPSWTLRRAGKSVSRDIQLMRQAVAYHRRPDARKALQAIDQLVALRPKDPFVHELRGQILLESRNTAAAERAYGRAAALAPRNALILGGHGRALLVQGKHSQALQVLEKSRRLDYRNSRVLRDMSVAYAKQGKMGLASLVTAERYALIGKFDDALIHTKRAAGQLPRGSGPWLRAQDVLSAAEAQAKKRK